MAQEKQEVSAGEDRAAASQGIGTLLGGIIGGIAAGVGTLGMGIPAGIAAGSAIGGSIGGMAGATMKKNPNPNEMIGAGAKLAGGLAALKAPNPTLPPKGELKDLGGGVKENFEGVKVF